MIRADVELTFFRRFLWIAIACVIGTGWCLLDALVTYPRKLEISQVYESFPQTTAGTEQWEEEAQKRGWLAEAPEKSAHELEALILNQYILMAGCVVVGFVMFLKWYLPRGSWIEGDEETIRDSHGKEHLLAQLVGIDKRRWEQKGIAVLHFRDKDRTSKFILDDFKYNRENMGKILSFAEAKLQTIIEGTQTDQPQNS
ncbi:MAG: hypothetical protein L7U72_10165 [Rubripirellula sp.]|nr:hypothetical protein [Rubripirellula sp.]